MRRNAKKAAPKPQFVTFLEWEWDAEHVTIEDARREAQIAANMRGCTCEITSIRDTAIVLEQIAPEGQEFPANETEADDYCAAMAASATMHARFVYTGVGPGGEIISARSKGFTEGHIATIANEIIDVRRRFAKPDPTPPAPRVRYSGYAAICHEMQPAYDPRHIEAFIRTQYGTLDHLTRADFRREARIAARCIDEAGKDFAEQVAQSYGL